MVILMVPVTSQSQCLSKRYQGLRTDQPIYLCDANGIASYRAARILKRMVIKIYSCLKADIKMDW